ncbi:putative lipid II flippase FtsW [Nocardioides mangrovicus]|uniref:Probable peptidoglycan glycosyltransferase FtsW n=1 Tax=Nocardioides mangrovicus TaxID=2478913 RepID=A0A3L8P1P7_9ACTN|nr:putative lipid II flippase FtsW [Nocardioides mangrovicus]RLV48961.1 putative lipid II flippase FtsW [Nocardioides mangrovicus]
MTTQAEPHAPLGAVAGVRGWLGSWTASVRETLDKPLTPYYLLVGASGLLLAIGLMEVLSASSVSAFKAYGNSYHWFIRQVIWVAIGLPVAVLVIRVPHHVVRRFAWLAIVVSLALIAATQSPLGVTVNGNRNWLSLGGPFQIQPAEVAKFSLILWISHIYARKDRLLGDWRHVMVPVVPMVATIVGLVVVLGGDLGTGLVLFAITLGLLWVAGAPMKFFVAAASTAGVVCLTLAATSPVRMARLTSFANPFEDFSGTGYQAGHGILGIASGGIFGKGIGASQQKWGTLPYPHTDFIFAVLGEELGLVGTLLVLSLFLAIAYAGIRIALQAQDPFVRYMAAGITVWLTVQMIINIGMVLALLPVIGIPLPLVSYGGSSLVPELVGIGLLVSFARHEPGAAQALQLRRRRRSRAPGATAKAR